MDTAKYMATGEAMHMLTTNEKIRVAVILAVTATEIGALDFMRIASLGRLRAPHT